MRINFTKLGNPLFFYFLLVIGLLPAITPEAGAEEKPLSVQKVTEELALRYPLTLKVMNLPDWLRQPDKDLSQLILYIDGVAFKDLKPSLIEGDKLLFDLRRTDKNKEAWTTILSRKGGGFFYCFVPVTIGFENGAQVPSNAKLKLIRIHENGFRVFVTICIVAIVLFVLLARKSDIIRNTGSQPEGLNSHGKANRKAYSLARSQMAFWFFTISIGYVFIWMVTSDFSSLTPGVIGLMGISAVTGVGAAVVDSNKRSELKNQRRMLDEKNKIREVEVAKLNSGIDILKASINAAAASVNLDEQKALLAAKQAERAGKQKEMEQARQKIKELDDQARPSVSKNFINDILSDDNGVSFHRFQIFVWTIVLIVIFLGKVYDNLAMPSFDGTLLALMGISNGTYIGFKLPDQQG